MCSRRAQCRTRTDRVWRSSTFLAKGAPRRASKERQTAWRGRRETELEGKPEGSRLQLRKLLQEPEAPLLGIVHARILEVGEQGESKTHHRLRPHSCGDQLLHERGVADELHEAAPQSVVGA